MKEKDSSKEKKNKRINKKEVEMEYRLSTQTGKTTVFRLRKKKFYFSF